MNYPNPMEALRELQERVDETPIIDPAERGCDIWELWDGR